MRALFLIDWIVDYINTPRMEITAGQEVLFYFALSIIFVGVVALISIIWKVINWINERR